MIRDVFTKGFTKLVVPGGYDWDIAAEYIRYVAPELADRVERWTDSEDLFAAYRVGEQAGQDS